MDKKRIFLILGFLAFTLVIGVVLWRIFFAPSVPPVGLDLETPGAPGSFPGAGPATGVPGTGLPQTGFPGSGPIAFVPGGETPDALSGQEEGIQLAADVRPLGATGDASGSAKFYNQQDGKFYRLLADGTLVPLSDSVFFSVQNVTWSPVSDESIIEYPDGSNIYFNFDTKEQVTLPQHWEDFSFSPLGSGIAAKSIGFSPENRWLVTADPQGNNIELIEPLGQNANKVEVGWSPNNQIIATALTGESLGPDRQQLLFVGKNGENFPSTIIEGRGLVTQWSPNGNQLLYSVYNAQNGFRPELWIVNASGNAIGTGRKLLGTQTWADKCTFTDERFIYCAVPTSLPEGAGFKKEIANTIPDTIIKIDALSGLTVPVETTPQPSISSLFIGDSGKTLFFTSTAASGLFSLPIE